MKQQQETDPGTEQNSVLESPEQADQKRHQQRDQVRLCPGSGQVRLRLEHKINQNASRDSDTWYGDRAHGKT